MSKDQFSGVLERVDECCWKIPRSDKQGMRVDGLIFSSELLIENLKKDQAADQVANVAFLPGIQHASLAMPDIHWGYGFCIGGVCATDPDEGGVISPGGVGYDINCGVRLMRTNLMYREVKPHLRTLVETLFKKVPTGVGKSGKFRFDRKEMGDLLWMALSSSSSAIWGRPATSSSPKPTASWTAPTSTPSAAAPSKGARHSAVPWVPATIFWRCK